MKIKVAIILSLMSISHTKNSYADSSDPIRDKAMMKFEVNEDGANTKNNSRDNKYDTVLPEDQSNKGQYIERTANIRKVILADDNLSLNGRNVKIITLDNGVVVLRGPVDSDKEKAKIEETAVKFSGDSLVKSFLEVVNR